MSKILYFDCFSGISGDMVLGSLLDAGLPLDELKRALGSLAVSGYEIDAKKVLRAGVSSTKFVVHDANARHEHLAPSTKHQHEHLAPSTQHEHLAPGTSHQHEHPAPAQVHPHRGLPDIFKLIDGSALSASGRDRAKALFKRLAEVEGAIHHMPVEQVHLHEVGALDSIIDIVGAVFGLEWLGVDQVVCSPLNVGGGMVHSAHGVFPVPAPATVKLLEGVPIYGGTIQQELVTPTGALIASSYASSFGAIPPMMVERIGYGAGGRDIPDTPNVLRILVGQTAERSPGDRVTVLECEIDDMNPQIFGSLMDKLYDAGALEVFYVPVQMKKNRPGTLLTVIVPPAIRPTIADLVFRETTTIGLRYADVDRECLQRESVSVETPIGTVRFKVARRNDRLMNASPEFEDCVRLAAANNLSVKEVQALAIKAYQVD
jgi:pyridinium-3,5-bisthiocarboxylic acid mononucleotide nickel chelatase